jgi:hypothetical protein
MVWSLASLLMRIQEITKQVSFKKYQEQIFMNIYSPVAEAVGIKQATEF